MRDWRTTVAGVLAALSVLLGAAAAALYGDWSQIDPARIFEALSTLGLGASLAWLGWAAADKRQAPKAADALEAVRGKE